MINHFVSSNLKSSKNSSDLSFLDLSFWLVEFWKLNRIYHFVGEFLKILTSWTWRLSFCELSFEKYEYHLNVFLNLYECHVNAICHVNIIWNMNAIIECTLNVILNAILRMYSNVFLNTVWMPCECDVNAIIECTLRWNIVSEWTVRHRHRIHSVYFSYRALWVMV